MLQQEYILETCKMLNIKLEKILKIAACIFNLSEDRALSFTKWFFYDWYL